MACNQELKEDIYAINITTAHKSALLLSNLKYDNSKEGVYFIKVNQDESDNKKTHSLDVHKGDYVKSINGHDVRGWSLIDLDQVIKALQMDKSIKSFAMEFLSSERQTP